MNPSTQYLAGGVPNPAVQALNANWNSMPQQVKRAWAYAIQGNITGTPTGTFTLQASNDPAMDQLYPTSAIPANAGPVNWTSLTTPVPIAVSAAGTFLFSVANPGYNWIRLIYVDGSGGLSTSTLSATVTVKAI
jgi:hypothetical protein